MRAPRILGRIALALAIALASAWCVLAILRAPVGKPLVREEVAALFGLISLGALAGAFLPRWRRRALGG